MISFPFSGRPRGDAGSGGATDRLNPRATAKQLRAKQLRARSSKRKDLLLFRRLRQRRYADVAEAQVGSRIVPLQADRPFFEPAAFAGIIAARAVVGPAGH